MSPRDEVSTLRRRLIVGGFVVIFAGAGVLNSVVKRHDLAGIQGASAATSSITLGSHATSSAWYCPGPLPIGHRGERSSIEISNLSPASVHARVHIASNTGMNTIYFYVIAGMGHKSVVLPSPKVSTYGAVSVVVSGRGVGVNQVIVTPAGITTSACTTHTAQSTYFGTGSTAGSANMVISLFNPGATPAVADLRFTVGSIATLPSAFSSVPIEPGQDVVLFAGHALPQRNAMSLAVTTVSGRIAVGAMHFKVTNGVLGRSLTLGTQIPLGTWWFPPTVVAPGIEQIYSLLNPTAHQERVRLTLSGAGAEGAVTLLVGPDANLSYVVPRLKVAGLQSSLVEVIGRGLLIVDRELIVNRPLALSSKTRQIQLPSLLPAGFSITSPNVSPAKIWMLDAGRSDKVASEVIAIVNPQRASTSVSIDEIVQGRSVAIPGVAPFEIASRSLASVDLGLHIKNAPGLEIVVHATKPVVAGMTEYSYSTLGLSAPSALPVR